MLRWYLAINLHPLYMQYMKSLAPPDAETRKSTQQCICTSTHTHTHTYITCTCAMIHTAIVLPLMIAFGVCACAYTNVRTYVGAWIGVYESRCAYVVWLNQHQSCSVVWWIQCLKDHDLRTSSSVNKYSSELQTYVCTYTILCDRAFVSLCSYWHGVQWAPLAF